MRYLTKAMLDCNVSEDIIRAWSDAIDVRGPGIVEALIQKSSYFKVEEVRLHCHSYSDFMRKVAEIHRQTARFLDAWAMDLAEAELGVGVD
jgi:hypothetical protein